MADQPNGDMVTTFTFQNLRYGVDQAGQLWRLKRSGNQWVNAGGKLPEVKPEEA